MEENVLELRHICKYFPGIKANDDISLTLRKGEIHELLGENGAGKSTLMSMVSGLYEPDSEAVVELSFAGLSRRRVYISRYSPVSSSISLR